MTIVYKTPNNNISFIIFQVHLYTIEQLRLFMKMDVNRYLYFDATSGIIQKNPDQKNVFLYSLVWRHPLPGKVALPLAEMLSTDQHSREIRHFLTTLTDSARANGFLLKPRKLESDFSFAILQAECFSFNNCDLRAYIAWCWQVQNKNMTMKEIKEKTIIHTCVAHCMKMFSRQIAKHVPDRKLRQFILYCLGYFVNLTTMVEVRDLFHQFCTVFGSPRVDTTVEEVMRNLKLKVKAIDVAKYEEADDQDSAMTCGLSVSTRNSEFYVDCLKIYSAKHIAHTSSPKNNYYCEEFLKTFLNLYTAYIPLWTGIMLADLTSLSKELTTDVSQKPAWTLKRDIRH